MRRGQTLEHIRGTFGRGLGPFNTYQPRGVIPANRVGIYPGNQVLPWARRNLTGAYLTPGFNSQGARKFSTKTQPREGHLAEKNHYFPKGGRKTFLFNPGNSLPCPGSRKPRLVWATGNPRARKLLFPGRLGHGERAVRQRVPWQHRAYTGLVKLPGPTAVGRPTGEKTFSPLHIFRRVFFPIFSGGNGEPFGSAWPLKLVGQTRLEYPPARK